MNPAEPTKAEVLGWMRRLNRGASEAVDQFWPGLEGPERSRVVARVRKWAELARKAGEPEAPAKMQATPAAAPAPSAPAPPEPPLEPDFETARLSPVQFIERQLAWALADEKRARARKLDGLLAAYSKRVSDLHAALLRARAEEGSAATPIDRSVVGVTEAVDRRHKALEVFRRAKGA